MGKLKYYRQETPYTCGAACLRMILSEYKDYPEKVLCDLSRTTDLGVTPLGLVSAAEELEYEVNVCKHADLSELYKYLPGVVLINPGIIAGKEPTISGHFVVIKEVGEDRVVINDPDPLYGGENKNIDLDIFIRAWRIMSSWIIQVKKRRKDE